MFQRKDVCLALLACLPLSLLVWLALVFGPAWTEPHVVSNIPLFQYFGMSPLEKVEFLSNTNLADRTVTGFEKAAYLIAANPLPYVVYWLALLGVLIAVFFAGAAYARRASGLVVG